MREHGYAKFTRAWSCSIFMSFTLDFHNYGEHDHVELSMPILIFQIANINFLRKETSKKMIEVGFKFSWSRRIFQHCRQ